MKIADIRKEYTLKELDLSHVAPGPIEQFKVWFEEAVVAELPEPTAMTVSTVSPDGRPSARILLLKGVEEDGFVFFTNYTSRKGKELDQNPNISLLFFWAELERQVRIEGKAVKVDPKASDEYFDSRPLGSKLGAWASPQSEEIPSREALEENIRKLQEKFKEGTVPRPPHWGGYKVLPTSVEFWQGRASRLHDRLLYVLNGPEEWSIKRLAP